MSTVICYARKHFSLRKNLLSNIVLSNLLLFHMYLLVICRKNFISNHLAWIHRLYLPKIPIMASVKPQNQSDRKGQGACFSACRQMNESGAGGTDRKYP